MADTKLTRDEVNAWLDYASGKHDVSLKMGVWEFMQAICRHYLATEQDARVSSNLPPTGPFVERIVRIFRDKPHDDTSALVLRDYALEALTQKEPPK